MYFMIAVPRKYPFKNGCVNAFQSDTNILSKQFKASAHSFKRLLHGC